MPVKSSEYEEINVSLAHNLLPEGVSGSPSRVRKHFWRNISQTVFGVVCGLVGGRILPLKVREDGALYVVTATEGYSNYNVYRGTTSDDYTGNTTHVFPQASSLVHVLIEQDDVMVQFKHAYTDIWTSEMVLPMGLWTVPIIIAGIRLKNRTPGYSAWYQVVMYY